MTIKNFSSLIFLIISELIPLRCFSIEAEKEITTMNETLTFKGVTKYHELPYIGTTQISVIASGLLGKITELNDQYVSVELAPNLTVKMQKSAIAAVLPKDTLKSI